MIVTLAGYKNSIMLTTSLNFKFYSQMKKIFFLLFLLPFFAVTAQQNDEHVHDVYCRHYPENEEITKFAFRNDWQSSLVHNYDVTFYFLDIEVSNTSITVGGTVEIHGKVVSAVLDTFAFELITAHSIESIIFNEVIYQNFSRVGDNVLVPVAAINQGETFIASITYGGVPPTGGFFSGITNAYSSTWQKHVTWTLSEPFAAKDWFPCKQVLTDKADSVWVFLTTPQGTMAGSQGLLRNITPMPDNKLRYEWKSNYPIAYYLISFAVSDYMEYNIYAKPSAMNGDSILIQNFVYNNQNYLNQQKINIDATAPMLQLFSDLYLLYPFHEEKYGHCITLLGGGMEHQTMSTMGNFSFDLVAHELAHMWFGDNVTCATWSDIWINEGFATYSNYLAIEMMIGWNTAQGFIQSRQNNVMSQAGGSVYIPPTEISPTNVGRIFNGRLSYNKGAAILHVLRHEINNDEVYFDIMNTFQIMFTDSTATGEDFRMVAEQVSGLDFEQFFAQWYYGEGYPKYDIEWYMSGTNVHLNVTQTPSSSTPLFKMTMDYKLNFSDNTHSIVRLFQDENFNQFVVPVDKQVISIQVDPNNWTFEKVNSIAVTIPEKENESYFTFGPNPANELIHVYFPSNDGNSKTLEITDLAGKTILRKVIADKETSIDVSGLSNGTYLLRATNGKQEWVRKLVK